MTNETEKPEFWEKAFIKNHEMWGFKPSNSAVLTKDFFIHHSVKNILIPGIGYGRNAQIFRDNGIAVTGIEISKTAIEMAAKHYGTGMTKCLPGSHKYHVHTLNRRILHLLKI